MALTLIDTWGDASANTYVNRADADIALEQHRLYATWSAATGEVKDAALLESTRMLDEYVKWNGKINSDDQALRCPRSELYDLDGRTVDPANRPKFLLMATSIFAAELVADAALQEAPNEADGISSVSVAGVVSVVFDRTQKKKVIPESVRSLVRGFGSIYGYSHTSSVVRG